MDAARIIRLPEVLSMTGLTRTILYAEMRAGRFPQSVNLTPNSRAVGWSSVAVAAWIAERLATVK